MAHAALSDGCPAGHYFKVWDSYGLSQYEFRAGSFSRETRGRWYFNIVVSVPVEKTTATKAVGIDLGLKDVAACSDGAKLENATRPGVKISAKSSGQGKRIVPVTCTPK